MIIDVIVPARDEAPTVAANVLAALECRYVREVIVVDDGSRDDTADVAREAGAKVLVLDSSRGSKAHAMAAGVASSDADAFLFVDADCTNLTGAHLDALCRPVLEHRAALSIGAFDYGPFWNPQVLRWPPLSGERVVPRPVWEAISDAKLHGYTIEMRINQVVAAARLPVSIRTLEGVSHRTKRDKHGRREGLRRTWFMYRDLLGMVWPFGDVRPRLYWFYLRALTVER